MSHWNEFDYLIINDDLTLAVTELESVLNGDGEANRVGSEGFQARIEKSIS